MRLNKRLTIISMALSLVSFATALIIHYYAHFDDKDFWVDIIIGVFSGAIIGLITSIVSFFIEKRRTLEGFFCHTQELLSTINEYQREMSVEDKIKFYLNYRRISKLSWDDMFGEIDFMIDIGQKKRQYIYSSIYKPISDFNHAVAAHEWHFRWYLDGSGRNEIVIQGFLKELEDYLIETGEASVDAPDKDDSCECKVNFVRPKLVENIQKELYGEYYKIMYGKKYNAIQ